jgi:hypothetical protein
VREHDRRDFHNRNSEVSVMATKKVARLKASRPKTRQSAKKLVVAEAQARVDDRARPYYEHRLAA